MEGGPGASAGGQDQRIFFKEFRRAHRAVGRLLIADRQSFCRNFWTRFIEGIPAQLVIRFLTLKDVPGNHQDRMSRSYNGFLFASPTCQAVVLGRQNLYQLLTGKDPEENEYERRNHFHSTPEHHKDQSKHKQKRNYLNEVFHRKPLHVVRKPELQRFIQ
jgi:Zn-finger nucleic acid-binding protein